MMVSAVMPSGWRVIYWLISIDMWWISKGKSQRLINLSVCTNIEALIYQQNSIVFHFEKSTVRLDYETFDQLIRELGEIEDILKVHNING